MLKWEFEKIYEVVCDRDLQKFHVEATCLTIQERFGYEAMKHYEKFLIKTKVCSPHDTVWSAIDDVRTTYGWQNKEVRPIANFIRNLLVQQWFQHCLETEAFIKFNTGGMNLYGSKKRKVRK